ncbi:hypothetical protein [Streptomyces albidoflavus]|uniref:hypothetical protein n=1 Tax=Streptomyces albidoflavus TaxID=1886 RepID=UPI0013EEBA39|nr:hypothetical protein [Streptomyces albidoflavus]
MTVPLKDGLKRRPGWVLAGLRLRLLVGVPVTDGLKRRTGWELAGGLSFDRTAWN